MEIVILIVAAVLVLIVVFAIALFTSFYYRVPPSEVFVVYGGRGDPEFVTNGGVFVTPIIKSYKKLDMTIMTIKTERDEVYTVSGIPIMLDWVAQVQIDGTSDAALRTAARAFLDKSREEVRQVISDTLSANFRAIVGQMTVEAIHRDRDDFVQRVQDLASDDVAAMGVQVISMGIEEIGDEQGYLQAMAAPQIAAIKRDASIAEAEADREARTKSADARRQAEQAELSATREILQQRQELELREVEVKRQVSLAQAESDQEVQNKRALAVERQQEAEVLVPARADRQAVEIRAEAERRRIIIEAEAAAQATRTSAEARAEATERTGRAEAIANQVMREAEAEGVKAGLFAEAAGKKADADAFRAMREAEADGIKASLLAEAEGRRELAAASAAEDEINLRQLMIEQIINADVEKSRAIAQALAGLGGNVRVVQFGGQGGGNGSGHGMTGNTFMDMLLDIPEVAEVFKAKVEALSGDDVGALADRITTLMMAMRNSSSRGTSTPQPAPPAQLSAKDEVATPPSAKTKPPKPTNTPE